MSAREVLFDPSWRSCNAIQGGLVIGELHAQAVAAVGGTPRTLHAHLLAGVVPGQVAQVTALPDRIGNSSSVRAELSQNGMICALAQILTMNRTGAAMWDETMDLDRPHPDQGEPLVLPPDFVPFGQYVDIRALGLQRPLSGGGGPPRLTLACRGGDILRHRGRSAVGARHAPG